MKKVKFIEEQEKISPAPVREEVNSRATSPVILAIYREVQRESGLLAEQLGEVPDNSQLLKLIAVSAERLGFEITNFERDEVLALVERDLKPFGILQELVDDPAVSDIIVTNYSKISVQRARRTYRTALSFSSQENYESFVERLLVRCGSTYSNKKPITDAMYGGIARIHAVHSCLCDSGPYLTIRINRFSSVTVSDLLEAGMAPVEIFAYLEGLLAIGVTVLVAGEVGSGKTTLVRALAATIPQDESVLVIEDTPEIRLQHSQVRYLLTRDSNTDGAGRVTPAEVIRGGMRMAMNRIIFGEMRDAEAAEAFVDVCASGHPGLSTIHSRTAAEAISRLELFLGRVQRGVNRAVLSDQIATAVQVVVHVDMCKVTRKRRIMEIREIGPVVDGTMRYREIFRYQLKGGHPSWTVLTRVSAHREKLEALSGSGQAKIRLNELPAALELGISKLDGAASFN